MTGLLGFDADQHVGDIALLAIQRGVRVFLPYYKRLNTDDITKIFNAAFTYLIAPTDPEYPAVQAGMRPPVGVRVGIIPIFETTAERALDGPVAGSEDGQRIRQYMTAVNQPGGTAYVLTGDFDEQAAQDATTYAYAGNAVAENPGNPMVAYGNGAWAEGLKSKGIAKEAWDAGGNAMRGTRADVQAGNEDIQQDVGDMRGLHLGIDLDSDFAPHANDPAELMAWTDPRMPLNPGSVVHDPAAPEPDPLPPPSPAPAPGQVAIPAAIDMQHTLAAKGYDIGPSGADGKWGPRSGAALQEYFADLGQV